MSDNPPPSSFDEDADFFNENRWQKLGRKLVEEPLIPIGCGLTCYALYQAGVSVRTGDHHRANRMFRARIYAQAFTIVAMCAGGFYYADDRRKRKDHNEQITLKKAREKRDKWIRELEAREKEEQELESKKKAYYSAMREQAEKRRDGAKSIIEPAEETGPIMQAILDLIHRNR